MSKRILLGPDTPIDLSKLIDTRLLIQANSGGGKSYAIRRLLEQTHGHVQQLVIDLEGEFATLRERYDYVLAAAKGGDTIVDPRSAKLLAERLLELGASAILDIYELKAHDRIRFVRYFLEALTDAPKKLWHPVLVIVDEAHVFCPQQGEAESAAAVIDAATRGRKRGQCVVLATQRISKLHKDAAAECNNVLIGRTGLDVDIKRAADVLGFKKDREQELRRLEPGHFFGFGPALTLEVRDIAIGPVVTTHPKAGSRIAFTPPPPTAAVRALLPQLADLPAEAEHAARTLEEAKKENAFLKREVTQLKKGLPPARTVQTPAKVEVRRVEVPILKDAQVQRLERSIGALSLIVQDLGKAPAAIITIATELSQAMRTARQPALTTTLTTGTPRLATSSRVLDRGNVQTRDQRPLPSSRAGAGQPPAEGLTGPQQKILDELAGLELLGLVPTPRIRLALMAGYTNPKSGGFTEPLGALQKAGYVEFPGQGQVQFTDAGRNVARFPEAPRSPEELQERLISRLDGPQAKILRAIIAFYPDQDSRESVATSVGYSNPKSGGFTEPLGYLRNVGLVDFPAMGKVRASPVLFLESQ